MHQYLFTNRARQNGAASESLGSISLKNDYSAIRFGRRVVREFMVKNPLPPGSFMDITQAGRAVGHIALVALKKDAPDESTATDVDAGGVDSSHTHTAKRRMTRLRRASGRKPIV